VETLDSLPALLDCRHAAKVLRISYALTLRLIAEGTIRAGLKLSGYVE